MKKDLISENEQKQFNSPVEKLNNNNNLHFKAFAERS